MLILLLTLLSPLLGLDVGGIICRQPRNQGFSCGLPHYSAFFFDISLGKCMPFIFKGCGGNHNKFLTREDCEDGCRSMTSCRAGLPLMDASGNIKRCDGDRIPCPGTHYCSGEGMHAVCCRKAARVCALSVDTGSSCGLATKKRYYYDSSTSTCRAFSFTGCGGNENNFKTKGECATFCSSEMLCKKGDPLPSPHSSNSLFVCSSTVPCPSNYTCVNYGQSTGACCPSNEFICGTPLDFRRPCASAVKHMWTFSHLKGRCLEVREPLVPVCDDQLNSFVNIEQCIDTCIGRCPSDNPVFVNPLTRQPHLCTEKGDGCPMGYECLHSSPFTRVCCKTMPTCVQGEAFMSTPSVPLQCNPDNDMCPRGYACTESRNLEYICCSVPPSCPEGLVPLMESSQLRVCTPSVPGTCPDKYICLHAPKGVTHVCCKPTEVCRYPVQNPITKLVTKCLPGDGRCPQGTKCLAQTPSKGNKGDPVFVCCSLDPILKCSDGSAPLERPDHSITKCYHNLDCPEDHECQQISSVKVCCPLPEEICIEALVADDLISCHTDQDCPSGSCTRAFDNNRYCCLEKVPRY